MMISVLSRFLTEIRLNLVILTKSLKFAASLQNSSFDFFMNHHKIIDWRNGCPVYTILSPAAYSDVQAHLISTKLRGLFQNRRFPDIVNLSLTNKCNCDCDHCCLRYEKQKGKEMTTEEAIDVIKQCQDLGVSLINFLGREPLLRKDILDVIRSVDKKRSATVMFTCGYYLEEYAGKLKEAGLDSIAVSIDSHIPERHDSIKKVKGIFERAIRGIKAAKKAGLTVAISCCVDEKSVKDGTLVNIIELGKKLGINEIIVFDAIPVGNISNRKDLYYEKEWIQDILDITKRYNERADYPGIYVYAYIRSYKGIGCGGGNYFSINPWGELCMCEGIKKSRGNVLKTPLYLLWDQLSTHADFCRASWKGCKMKDPEYRKSYNI